MTITIENESRISPEPFWEALITRVIEGALDYAACPYEACVSVLLTDDEEIARINREQRGIDRPTDVLSFPMAEYERPGDFDFLERAGWEYFHPETGELLLGDIVISMEKAMRQADQYGHSGEREVAFLTAHSMFHLFGYDHMEEGERKIMEAKQADLLDRLGIFR
ncbi:MAG: rRNA maturation RNase YbeY [Lachnospiraceae bacterium]|nr:rRNA maturation RNase YbeY [Lachnospiraceae bacterium]